MNIMKTMIINKLLKTVINTTEIKINNMKVSNK